MENCTANFRRIARKNLRVLSRRERRKVSANRATNVAIKDTSIEYPNVDLKTLRFRTNTFNKMEYEIIERSFIIPR